MFALFAATEYVYRDHMDGWGDGWWVWGFLMMLLFVVAIGVAVWLATRSTQHNPPPHAGLDRARGILAERYARGELTTDEYHERLDALR